MMIDKSFKTNPVDISEGFNAYFSSIAEKLLPKYTAGTKHFSEYLANRVNQNFIFLSADQVEIISIIDSLDNNKGTGPYSIPKKLTLKASPKSLPMPPPHEYYQYVFCNWNIP